MGTATRKLGDNLKKGWLVRNEQGETFGPVDFETLRAWACDGRLAPANEVSENGTDWLPATASRALEMNWVAEVSPGTFYGPIHKRAMEELVRDGSISRSSAFFSRHGLDGKDEPAAEQAHADRVRLLTEQYAQAQQQLAVSEGQLREAQRQKLEAEDRLRESRRQIQENESQALEARRQAAELDAHMRHAQAQAEQARQQAAADARLLQAQLAEREEQAQRRVTAYEEQVRLAQQQAGAFAGQLEQVRQQAAAADAQLRATVRQLSEQAEQARAAQQQWVAKADGLASELEAARQAHAALVAKAAEQRAEHAAETAARDAATRALETERHTLGETLAQTRAEAARQADRLVRLEQELDAARGAGAGHGELDARLRAMGAELSGVRQALAGEQEAVQQARARCATLEAALEAAREREVGPAAASDGVSAELRQLRQQIEALCALVGEFRAAREAPARPVERVYVEAEPVEVLPPGHRSAGRKGAPPPEPGPETVRAAPEDGRKPSDPPKAANAARGGTGLSMAELEQQARRELERLGAQGVNLFKRNK